MERLESVGAMAFSLSVLEQDLSCPVCYDIYKDPVILSCTHSFCRDCLQKTWANKDERECPLCKRRCFKEHPLSDRALNNACESYMQRKRERDSRSEDMLCSVHFEKLNLFCVDDEKLACSECLSQDHQNHRFCSISKAASTRKANLKTNLKSLQDKLETFSKVKQISDEIATHIKSQAQHTERQIKVEFEKLHQFLIDEEQARISALRDEEEEKSRMMKKKIDGLDKHVEEIKKIISELNNKLNNDTLLLQDFKRASERAQYRVADPKLDSGALINVAKHVGNLRYRVWQKMKALCPYFPVILDLNTANSSLLLSGDLSNVSCSDENSELPDNPERISAYCGVLGSKGFSSGTHSWVVDVGESEEWVIGVAEESLSRKESIFAVKEKGFCCIWRVNCNIFAGNSTKILLMKTGIVRIRVMLKYEVGQVCFSDVENNKQLYTFKYTFTKRMYPYFFNVCKNSIKILPDQVSIKPLIR